MLLFSLPKFLIFRVIAKSRIVDASVEHLIVGEETILLEYAEFLHLKGSTQGSLHRVRMMAWTYLMTSS